MAEESRITLKAYLETDDVPTETQFSTIIDSVSNIVDDGLLQEVDNNIVAHIGGGQADATLLYAKINRISSCFSNFDSVKLPSALKGNIIHVYNSTAATLGVFPYTDGYIDNLAQNARFDIGSDSTCIFACYVQGKWFSM